MAYNQVVTDAFTSRLADVLKAVSDERGAFALAMVVPSESGLSNKWNLVASAPWIDRESIRTAVVVISSALKQLPRAFANRIERISVLPSNDDLVRELTMLNFLGDVPYRLIDNLALSSRGIPEAIVFSARKPHGGYIRIKRPAHVNR